MDPETGVRIWDAINKYARTCGGDTSDATLSSAKMHAARAVDAEIERAIARVMPWAAHCLGCGRIWVESKETREQATGDTCPGCGKELYPVTRKLVPGQEVRLGDDHEVRVLGVLFKGHEDQDEGRAGQRGAQESLIDSVQEVEDMKNRIASGLKVPKEYLEPVLTGHGSVLVEQDRELKKNQEKNKEMAEDLVRSGFDPKITATSALNLLKVKALKLCRVLAPCLACKGTGRAGGDPMAAPGNFCTLCGGTGIKVPEMELVHRALAQTVRI